MIVHRGQVGLHFYTSGHLLRSFHTSLALRAHQLGSPPWLTSYTLPTQSVRLASILLKDAAHSQCPPLASRRLAHGIALPFLLATLLFMQGRTQIYACVSCFVANEHHEVLTYIASCMDYPHTNLVTDMGPQYQCADRYCLRGFFTHGYACCPF